LSELDQEKIREKDEFGDYKGRRPKKRDRGEIFKKWEGMFIFIEGAGLVFSLNRLLICANHEMVLYLSR
jgi:hypothetical protein